MDWHGRRATIFMAVAMLRKVMDSLDKTFNPSVEGA